MTSEAITYTLQNINQTVPDNDAAGIHSTIVIGSNPGRIGDLNLSLVVSGGYTGDIYATLSKEGGPGFAVLLNRVGRSTLVGGDYGTGFQITLDDQAPADVHLSGVQSSTLTGIWQPDGRTSDPSVVLASDPRTALLASFNGMDSSGNWTLFVADLDPGGESKLVSWSLDVQAVPDNSPAGPLLLWAAFGLWVTGRIQKRQPRQS